MVNVGRWSLSSVSTVGGQDQIYLMRVNWVLIRLAMINRYIVFIVQRSGVEVEYKDFLTSIVKITMIFIG